MENISQKELDYAIAKARVQQLKKFYLSLAVFTVVFGFYFGRKFLLTGDLRILNFHSFTVIFWLWGFILAIKGIKLFVFNKDWERKIMDRELNTNDHGSL